MLFQRCIFIATTTGSTRATDSRPRSDCASSPIFFFFCSFFFISHSFPLHAVYFGNACAVFDVSSSFVDSAGERSLFFLLSLSLLFIHLFLLPPHCGPAMPNDDVAHVYERSILYNVCVYIIFENVVILFCCDCQKYFVT